MVGYYKHQYRTQRTGRQLYVSTSKTSYKGRSGNRCKYNVDGKCTCNDYINCGLNCMRPDGCTRYTRLSGKIKNRRVKKTMQKIQGIKLGGL